MDEVNKGNAYITIQGLSEKVMQAGLAKPRRDRVSFILRKELSYSYRKATVKPVRTNSTNVKILHQLYARKFIELFTEDKVIINIDESLFQCNQMISRAWIKKNTPRNFAIETPFKSTSLTAAITTEG